MKATVLFLPDNQTVQAENGVKILALAIKNKIKINYSCGVCQCATCVVRVISGKSQLTEMKPNEEKLLLEKNLLFDLNRLACQTRIKITEPGELITIEL